MTTNTTRTTPKRRTTKGAKPSASSSPNGGEPRQKRTYTRRNALYWRNREIERLVGMPLGQFLRKRIRAS